MAPNYLQKTLTVPPGNLLELQSVAPILSAVSQVNSECHMILIGSDGFDQEKMRVYLWDLCDSQNPNKPKYLSNLTGTAWHGRIHTHPNSDALVFIE